VEMPPNLLTQHSVAQELASIFAETNDTMRDLLTNKTWESYGTGK